MKNSNFETGLSSKISLDDFLGVVYQDKSVSLSSEARKRLGDTRRFIKHLLESRIKVYGITTGFADLRKNHVSPENAAELSHNILQSHDAGIGEAIPEDVTLGAMLLRAHSLSQGYSGFQEKSLETLIQMINKRIVPVIPSTGSLGASGDLAFLARLGRAMQGMDVPVRYQGETNSAKKALESEGIEPFIPEAKEGLALTNGTSFMISMCALAYSRQVKLFKHLIVLQGLFLNAVGATEGAFVESIQTARGQKGQKLVAKMLSKFISDSPMINRLEVQNDYCIRCIPQLFGPRWEAILEQEPKILAEMNAVTDNPLIFKGNELSNDIPDLRKIPFEGEDWAVISAGNFHGEYLTSISDTMVATNAKMALTIERQLTYMLNPARNGGHLPTYLIDASDVVGLNSGYMIPHYTANGLAQKIAHLGVPTSLFNITSGNESEDVVSYGASASQRWLQQLDYFEQMCTIYLTVVTQAYALSRKKESSPPDSFLADRIFSKVHAGFDTDFPTIGDQSFEQRYMCASNLLKSGDLLVDE